jgi:hypothetical protein
VVLLAAAGAASAESVHTIAVPGATGVEAPAVTRFGSWEVAVSFDPGRCEIACVYRLRRDRFGRAPAFDFLLPPAVAIHVFYGAADTTVLVDPAHSREPSAAPEDRLDIKLAALPTARVEPQPALTANAVRRVDPAPARSASHARPVFGTLRI